MNIGFDLDKVFINYPPFVPDIVIERLYRKKANGVLEYRIPSTPEQLIRKLSHLYFFRPAIRQNINAVKMLPKKNNTYFLISSRYKFLEGVTRDILKRYRIDTMFDEMHFNFDNKQPHEFKNELIKKLHIDRYVDDDLHLLKYMAEKNPDKKFYWLNKNKNRPITKNVFAITSISDIMK